MKKSLQVLIFFTIMLIGIAGCKKSTTTTSNNGSAKNNGTVLSSFIELDTTLAAPYDTIQINTYNYDNLNRLTSLVYTFYYNSGKPATMTDYDTVHFYYNGTDTAFYKSIQSVAEQDYYASRDTTYYFYNSTNNETKDSTTILSIPSGSSSGTIEHTQIVNNYLYAGVTVSDSEVINTDWVGGSRTIIDTVTHSIANGNIISESDNDYLYLNTSSVTFDSHPNPFYHMNGVGISPIYSVHTGFGEEGPVVAPIYGVYYMLFDGLQFGVQKNNCTEINDIHPGNNYVYLHIINKFSYQTNGYPATISVFDQSGGNPDVSYKGVYIYK